MAVAYRSDTGTLLSNSSTGFISVAFVGTQPSIDDLIVAGGSFHDSSANPWTPVVKDDVNLSGDYKMDVGRDTLGAVAVPFAAQQSAALIFSKRNKGKGNPHNVRFTVGTSAQFLAVGAVAFSSTDPDTAFDKAVSDFATDVDKTTQGTGTSAATTRADAVAVIALAVDNSATLVTLTATGYTVPVSSVDGASNAVGGLAYKILSAIGTQVATWTYGATSGAATNDHAAALATYKGINPGAVPRYSVSREWLRDVLSAVGIPNSALRDVRNWF